MGKIDFFSNFNSIFPVSKHLYRHLSRKEVNSYDYVSIFSLIHSGLFFRMLKSAPYAVISRHKLTLTSLFFSPICARLLARMVFCVVRKIREKEEKIPPCQKNKGDLSSLCPDEHGCTLLHYAALYGSYPIVKKLLDEGADVEIKDNDGCKALDYALSLTLLFSQDKRFEKERLVNYAEVLWALSYRANRVDALMKILNLYDPTSFLDDAVFLKKQNREAIEKQYQIWIYAIKARLNEKECVTCFSLSQGNETIEDSSFSSASSSISSECTYDELDGFLQKDRERVREVLEDLCLQVEKNYLKSKKKRTRWSLLLEEIYNTPQDPEEKQTQEYYQNLTQLYMGF